MQPLVIRAGVRFTAGKASAARGKAYTMGDHSHGHDPGREHGGGQAGHSHGVSADADRRWLGIALGLITVFMAGEGGVGVVAPSPAPVSGPAPILTDPGSIAFAPAPP